MYYGIWQSGLNSDTVDGSASPAPSHFLIRIAPSQRSTVQSPSTPVRKSAVPASEPKLTKCHLICCEYCALRAIKAPGPDGVSPIDVIHLEVTLIPPNPTESESKRESLGAGNQ